MHSKLVMALLLAHGCAGRATSASPPSEMRSTQNASAASRNPDPQSAVTASDATPDPAANDARNDISKFKHASDDSDISSDDLTSQDVNIRNAYWQQFAEQLSRSWAPPTGTMTQNAIGCFHILPEGRIAETRLTAASGHEAIDGSIRLAMTSMQTARDKNPELVPTDQLLVIKRWVCFSFTAEAQARRTRGARSAPPRP